MNETAQYEAPTNQAELRIALIPVNLVCLPAPVHPGHQPDSWWTRLRKRFMRGG